MYAYILFPACHLSVHLKNTIGAFKVFVWLILGLERETHNLGYENSLVVEEESQRAFGELCWSLQTIGAFLLTSAV